MFKVHWNLIDQVEIMVDDTASEAYSICCINVNIIWKMDATFFPSYYPPRQRCSKFNDNLHQIDIPFNEKITKWFGINWSFHIDIEFGIVRQSLLSTNWMIQRRILISIPHDFLWFILDKYTSSPTNTLLFFLCASSEMKWEITFVLTHTRII